MAIVKQFEVELAGGEFARGQFWVESRGRGDDGVELVDFEVVELELADESRLALDAKGGESAEMASAVAVRREAISQALVAECREIDGFEVYAEEVEDAREAAAEARANQ